jgi:hypothetical protein
MRQRIIQRVLVVLCAGALAGCASGRRTSHEDGSPGAVANAPDVEGTPGVPAVPDAADEPGARDVDEVPDEPGVPEIEDEEGAPAAGRAPAPGLASVGAGASPAGGAEAGRTGALDVTVTFADAPPHLRRSPGRNACGAARAPRVQVHTLGGVAGAVVYLRAHGAGADPAREQRAEAREPRAEAREQRAGAREPRAEAREQRAGVVAVRQCRVEPRVVVAQPGQTLAMINDDERRLDARVTQIAHIERLAADAAGASRAAAGPAGPGTAATFALPVVGSRVDLRWPEPGVYRVAAADTEPGFVVVPGASPAGVTSVTGQVRLAALPIGSYDVIVWHPPLHDDDGAPVVARAQVTIAPGETSQLTIPLAIPLAPR